MTPSDSYRDCLLTCLSLFLFFKIHEEKKVIGVNPENNEEGDDEENPERNQQLEEEWRQIEEEWMKIAHLPMGEQTHVKKNEELSFYEESEDEYNMEDLPGMDDLPESVLSDYVFGSEDDSETENKPEQNEKKKIKNKRNNNKTGYASKVIRFVQMDTNEERIEYSKDQIKSSACSVM